MLNKVLEASLDALKDSAIVFAVALVLNVIISFVEEKIAYVLGKKNKVSPLIGSALGLVPQCGLSVVAADMYEKHHITMGTITALFLACSDEALPILLSNGFNGGDKLFSIILIIAIKFVVGFAVGYLLDSIVRSSKKEVHDHLEHCEHHIEEDYHHGCCNHEIEGKHVSKIHAHLVHPLIHSLKIFAYVLGINLILNIVLALTNGQEAIAYFLVQTRWLAPLVSTLVGMIPNCAGSVVITEMFLTENGISLGACLAGLFMNAGLGLLFLLKGKSSVKEKLIIVGTMFATSLFIGYLVELISLLIK